MEKARAVSTTSPSPCHRRRGARLPRARTGGLRPSPLSAWSGRAGGGGGAPTGIQGGSGRGGIAAGRPHRPGSTGEGRAWRREARPELSDAPTRWGGLGQVGRWRRSVSGAVVRDSRLCLRRAEDAEPAAPIAASGSGCSPGPDRPAGRFRDRRGAPGRLCHVEAGSRPPLAFGTAGNQCGQPRSAPPAQCRPATLGAAALAPPPRSAPPAQCRPATFGA
jgi:hypothetical protein